MYCYKEILFYTISKQIYGHSPTVDGGSLYHWKEQVALIAVYMYDICALWFEVGVTLKRRASTFDPNCINCVQRSHLCAITLAVMGVLFFFYFRKMVDVFNDFTLQP